MDSNNEPKVEEGEEEVHIDDNVDELFESKMRKLRDLGLYDDRMIDKVNLIKRMENDPSFRYVPKGQIKRRYQVLGRPETCPEMLQEFKGEKDDGLGAQKFKPIEGGLQWSLPYRKRSYRENPNDSQQTNDDREEDHNRNEKRGRERDRERPMDRQNRDNDTNGDNERNFKPKSEHSGDGFRDDYRTKTEFTNDANNHSNEAMDTKNNYDDSHIYEPSTSERVQTVVKEEPNKRVRFESVDQKPSNFNKFFDNRRSKPEEKKTETITDIEAFIRDCNKKAEKPKPLIFDDIDDFIEKANKRFERISANLDKTYS